jgi:hypothetical protein
MRLRRGARDGAAADALPAGAAREILLRIAFCAAAPLGRG